MVEGVDLSGRDHGRDHEEETFEVVANQVTVFRQLRVRVEDIRNALVTLFRRRHHIFRYYYLI